MSKADVSGIRVQATKREHPNISIRPRLHGNYKLINSLTYFTIGKYSKIIVDRLGLSFVQRKSKNSTPAFPLICSYKIKRNEHTVQ